MSQTWQEKTGASPGKLALVGVLAVVFVGVLVHQFGGLQFDHAADDEPEPAIAEQQEDGIKHDPTPTSLPAISAFPEISLAQAVAHNPFAEPPWACAKPPEQPPEPEPTADDVDLALATEQAFEELRQQGVRAIMISDGQRIAVVGSRHVRVGDEMDGWRVLEISADGVILAPPESTQ